MEVSPLELSVVVAAAIGGCLATAVAFFALTGKSISIIAGNWRKHFWSIIFALPALVIFDLNVPLSLALLSLIAWLILAPSIAAKFVFGAKDAAWSFLLMLHSAYAFTVLAMVLVLSDIIGLN